MARPEACNFEKLTQYSLHKQEGLGIVAKTCFHYERDLSELIKFYSPWNHQITIDFLKILKGKKTNYFAQIESIMEVHLNPLWRQSFTSTILNPIYDWECGSRFFK